MVITGTEPRPEEESVKMFTDQQNHSTNAVVVKSVLLSEVKQKKL